MKIPTSYHQERLWFIDMFESGYLYESSPTYHNIPLILDIKGPLDVRMLEQSIRGVINRHEALRTQIITEEDKPFQQVNREINFNLSVLDLNLTNDGNGKGYEAAVFSAIEEANRSFLLHKDPLIRGKLIRFEQQRFILVVTIHYILADRYSIGILAEEILLYYKGYLKEKTPQLPDLSIHYADFSQWQRELPVKLMESLLGYWKIKLSGKLQVLELPTDRPRALAHTFQSKRQSIAFSKDLSDRIRAYGKQQGVGNFVTLLAAFKVLLHRYTGHEEIVVGTSVANRNQPDLERVIGPIANLLVLRSDFSTTPSFRRFASQLLKTVDDAYKYQLMPFDKLVSELNPDKDMSRTALFDVLFKYEDTPLYIPPVDGLEISVVETNLGWGKYDLDILVQNEGETFSGILVYNSDYYNDSTISRMIQHYMRLLDGILEEPERQISTFSLLTDQEQHQLLVEWNQSQIDYPKDKTIHEIFEEQVARTPNNIAVVGRGYRVQDTQNIEAVGANNVRPEAKTGEQQLSFKELNEKANQLARMLREKGVKPGSIVGLLMDRSFEMIIGIIGILKAGGAYLPMDPDYPEERIKFMQEDSSARILVSEGIEVIDLNQLTDSPTHRLPHSITQPGPSNLAYIIYTSGTTGKPKGSMIEHRNVVRLMFNDRNLFDFNSRDVWTMFHSYCFDFSVWEMYGALLYGGKLIVIPKAVSRDPGNYLKILKAQGVSVLNQTPSSFYNLASIEVPMPGKELRIRYIIFGGEALNPVHLKGWEHKYPETRLVNMFGITETTVHVTYKEITGQEIELNISNIGRPIPTLGTYVMDCHLNLLPIGVPGELYVGGEGVGRGYLCRSELTGKKFIENPYKKEERIFKSGDLVKVLENGDMEYLGRIDNQVKIRGFRIELGEIESRLQTHPEIIDAAVLAREEGEEGGDKCLCAYIVSNNQLSLSDLREYLARKLPDYMIPSHFVSLDKFPLTPNGKVDRKALPLPEVKAGADYQAPTDEVEEQLVTIWSEVLRLEKDVISIDADFFELGGHSLKATILVSKIHKDINVKVPLSEIFTNSTIRGLSRFIKKSEKDIYTAIEPTEKMEYYPLSSAQKRLYFLEQLEDIGTSYNIPSVLKIIGKFDKNKYENVVKVLIDRHETLRTSFEVVSDKPVQRVYDTVQFEIQEVQAGRQELGIDIDINNIEELMGVFIQPFDLSQAPLLRVGFVKLSEEEHLLLYDIHHIICDGTSTEILIDEFIRTCEREELLPLKLQYKDFTTWQNHLFETGQIEKQEKYWMNRFSGKIPVLNFPTDYPRPDSLAFEGNNYGLRIGAEKTSQLKQLAVENDVTLYMVLLTVLNATLYKYTGQTDIIVGSGIMGRAHADLQKLIGMFVNTLAMWNQPEPEKTFLEFLKEVKETSLKAYENQDIQFEALVDKLNLERDPSRNPFFDVLFVVQNFEQSEVRSRERAQEAEEELPLMMSYPFENKTSKFHLSLYVWEFGDEIGLSLEYSTALFKRSTAEEILHRYVDILEQVIENKTIKLKDIKISHRLLEPKVKGFQEDEGEFDF